MGHLEQAALLQPRPLGSSFGSAGFGASSPPAGSPLLGGHFGASPQTSVPLGSIRDAAGRGWMGGLGSGAGEQVRSSGSSLYSPYAQEELCCRFAHICADTSLAVCCVQERRSLDVRSSPSIIGLERVDMVIANQEARTTPAAADIRTWVSEGLRTDKSLSQ